MRRCVTYLQSSDLAHHQPSWTYWPHRHQAATSRLQRKCRCIRQRMLQHLWPVVHDNVQQVRLR